MTREGKEIRTILREEWPHLADADPAHLATVILRFYDGGTKGTHRVLRSREELLAMCENTGPLTAYELNRKVFDAVRDRIQPPSSKLADGSLRITATTLMGWMHNKRDLGLEQFAVVPDGSVHLAGRVVLAKSVFRKVPSIRY